MATTLVTEGGRLYFVDLPFSANDRLRTIKAKWDADRRQWWVGIAKREAAEALVAAINAGPTDRELAKAAGDGTAMSERDDRRVFAKVTYDGSNYFVIAESRGKGRCMICKLRGSGFWVDMADCTLVRTYEGRQERGAYGRPTGRTVYTTLGSIRAFVERQKAAEKRGEPQCAACGKRGPMHHDLEDGLMKCFGCCDMPE